jgi:tRNA-specific adenosine deaminase 1
MNINANKVANTCYDFYRKNIPLNAKPDKNTEWTTLASILFSTNEDNNQNYNVLVLTTGTKCLAEKQLPEDGTLVHDSHAEILAVRCFKR